MEWVQITHGQEIQKAESLNDVNYALEKRQDDFPKVSLKGITF